MSLIRRDISAVKFHSVMKKVMQKGFENVLFDNKIYGYVLKPGVNLEELLVDTGRIFINERFDFERSIYRRVARDVINILNQFCKQKFYNGPAILMGRSMIDLACLVASFPQKFHNREFRQTSESLGGSAHGSQYNTRVAYMTAKGHSE